jgi:3-hydroxy-9,10-secoandrosta-1,3,5(10)-triene-9,17-dione monooxygenase
MLQNERSTRTPTMTRDEAVTRSRALIPLLRASAGKAESLRRVPPETIEAFTGTGLFRLMQPARFGGLELGFDVLVDIAIEMGRGCASSSWVCSLLASHAWLLALFPDKAQREVWTENPGAVMAASLAPKGKVKKVQGGYRLSGSWPFTSGVDYADWEIAGGLVPSAKGSGPLDMRLFLVPKQDYRVEDTWFTAGLRGTGSNTVHIDDVFVPEHRTVSIRSIAEGEGPGTAVNKAPMYRLPFVSALNFPLPAPSIGASLAALHDWTEWSRTRVHAFTGQEVASLTPLHLRLSESAAELDSARMLLLNDLAGSLRKIAKGGKLTLLERARSRRNAAYAMVLCSRAIQRIFQGSGASGLYDSCPIQRAWRDINAASVHVIMNWDAASSHYGRIALGLPPADSFY